MHGSTKTACGVSPDFTRMCAPALAGSSQGIWKAWFDPICIAGTTKPDSYVRTPRHRSRQCGAGPKRGCRRTKAVLHIRQTGIGAVHSSSDNRGCCRGRLLLEQARTSEAAAIRLRAHSHRHHQRIYRQDNSSYDAVQQVVVQGLNFETRKDVPGGRADCTLMAHKTGVCHS